MSRKIAFGSLGLLLVVSPLAASADTLASFKNWFAQTFSQSASENQTAAVSTVTTGATSVRESHISTRPKSSGNDNDRALVFKGDFSKVFSAEKMLITGADTLQKPQTGYVNNPLASGHFMTYEVSGSGNNQSLSQPDGRTAAKAYETRLYQGGQGDVVAYHGYGEIFSSRANATHWLANPAVVLMNGDMTISSPLGAHGYLQGTEINLVDNGYDAAAIGHVVNMTRASDTASLGEVWMGVRLQSTGSKSADVGYSATGKFKRGLDFGTADFGTSGAAISLADGQKVYFGGQAANIKGIPWYNTTLGGQYVYSQSGALRLAAGSKDMLTIAAGGVGVGTTDPRTAFDVRASRGSYNVTQVLASDGGPLSAIFSDGDENAWLRLFTTSGNESIRLNTNGNSYLSGGNVGIGTITPAQKLSVAGTAVADAWNTNSDARLKENVRPLASALEKLKNLRGVMFNWKAGSAHKDVVGVIAQEVEAEYPELVTTDDEGIKSVDYAKLTPILLEAIKELDARNKAIEARLEALEK
jgi:hypothetical protein